MRCRRWLPGPHLNPIRAELHSVHSVHGDQPPVTVREGRNLNFAPYITISTHLTQFALSIAAASMVRIQACEPSWMQKTGNGTHFSKWGNPFFCRMTTIEKFNPQQASRGCNYREVTWSYVANHCVIRSGDTTYMIDIMWSQNNPLCTSGASFFIVHAEPETSLGTWFGEFCSCCCLPPLPQLAHSILPTT